jgi:plasmid stabilization system protein ParE
MNVKEVVWPEPVLNKLRTFQSEHFTAEESYDYIKQFVLETENLLLNPVIGKSYTEESGEYRGYSRIVIRKFRVYFKLMNGTIVIVAVFFPGES